MDAAFYISRLLILSFVAEVWSKGAKVRPGQGKKKNRDQNRYSGSANRRSGGTSSDPLDYIAPYKFRNASNEERLLAYLFLDYDPVARAVVDSDKTVVVSIDFVLMRIHGLDERSQVLTTTGLVIAEWMDERLMWEPEKFGNLTDIIVKSEKLWLPELAVMNGAEELMPDFDRIRILLNYDGRIHWEPGGIFRTTCDIDIKYFPFDMQHCPLIIGAYSYYASKMNITNASSFISTHDFRKNGEWHVTSTSAAWNVTVLDCCSVENGYSHVVFTLNLRRRSNFYIMNIVLPCLMLSVLIMIGFFLPPEAGEKISLGISVLLAFTVFLLMIADNIPRTSLAIPLMVIYLTATMTLGTVSICMTVLVLNIHYRGVNGARQRVPRWLKILVLQYLSRLVCAKHAHRVAVSETYYSKKKHKMKASDGNGIADELELMALTVNSNPNKQMRMPPNAHVHVPANGPRAIPITPPNVERERSRNRRRTLPEPEALDLPDVSREWNDLAHVIDRLFFWILFSCMAVSAIFILLYPQYSGVDIS